MAAGYDQAAASVWPIAWNAGLQNRYPCSSDTPAGHQKITNDFGEQEPGSNKEIAKFCKLTYNVKFPMMEKSGVKRENANPVFTQLIAATGEAPEWNFHKYLVSRDGYTVQSFPAQLQPDDPKFLQAIDALLAQTAKN